MSGRRRARQPACSAAPAPGRSLCPALSFTRPTTHRHSHNLRFPRPPHPRRIAKSKQATAAGAAVAKGVATGMQAATVEIGTSLMNVAGDKKGGGGGGGGGVMDAPAVKAVGGVGMEILRVRLI